MFKTYLEAVVYDEQYLASQFTFGFELEGYAFDSDWEYEAQNYFSNTDIARNQNLNAAGDYKDDGSLNNYDLGESFEWASPVFPFTPYHIQKVIRFLDYAVQNFVNTDETCALHTHIGFPNHNNKQELGPQMMWILLNLVFDETSDQANNMLKDLLKFNGFEFYSKEYADFSFLIKLRSDILSTGFYKSIGINSGYFNSDDDLTSIYRAIANQYSDDKWRILRIHPAGTMEWRGVRGFLDRKRKEDITEFFTKRLYPFVLWIAKVLDKDKLRIDNNLTLDKKDLTEYLQGLSDPVNYRIPNKVFNQYMPKNQKTEITKKYKFMRPNKTIMKNVVAGIQNDELIIFGGGMENGKIDGNVTIVKGNFNNMIFNDCYLDGIKDFNTVALDVFGNDFKYSKQIKRTSYVHNLKISDTIVNRGSVVEVDAVDSEFDNCDKIRYLTAIDCKFTNMNSKEPINYILTTVRGGAIENCNFLKISNVDNVAINNSNFEELNNATYVTFFNDVNVNSLNRASDCTFNGGIFLNMGNISSSTINYGEFHRTNEIYESNILNGVFKDIRFDSCKIMDGTFEKCEFDNCDFYGGIVNTDGMDYKNESFYNCNWYNGITVTDGKQSTNSPLGTVPDEDPQVFVTETKKMLSQNIGEAAKYYMTWYYINEDDFEFNIVKGSSESCDACAGSGVRKGAACNLCLGTGISSSYQDYIVCPKCKDLDQNNPDCDLCQGYGQVLSPDDECGCNSGCKYCNGVDKRIIASLIDTNFVKSYPKSVFNNVTNGTKPEKIEQWNDIVNSSKLDESIIYEIIIPD